MNPKRRTYSLPYNGTNPEWFLQEVEKRKQNIDHVYCELPFNERERCFPMCVFPLTERTGKIWIWLVRT